MVQSQGLNRRFKKIPKELQNEAARLLEREATKIVAQMNAIKPPGS